MAKTKKISNFKKVHQYLQKVNKDLAAERKAETLRLCNFSEKTFYRNLDFPGNMSISDKITIAGIYIMPADILFPELVNETV